MLELGDESKMQNETNQVFCDVEFKTKGFFSGDYNAIGGRVRDRSGVVGEISGKWNEVMELKRSKVRAQVRKKVSAFGRKAYSAPVTFMSVGCLGQKRGLI